MEEIKILEEMIEKSKDLREEDFYKLIGIKQVQAVASILEQYKEAYAKANNYLYFNDSADYEVALWEVIRSLRPDLAEKWDNGEEANLKYIGE